MILQATALRTSRELTRKCSARSPTDAADPKPKILQTGAPETTSSSLQDPRATRGPAQQPTNSCTHHIQVARQTDRRTEDTGKWPRSAWRADTHPPKHPDLDRPEQSAGERQWAQDYASRHENRHAHPREKHPGRNPDERQWPRGYANVPQDHAEIHIRRHQKRHANPLEKHPARDAARMQSRKQPPGPENTRAPQYGAAPQTKRQGENHAGPACSP